MSIKINLEECCYKCNYPNIETRENKLMSFYGEEETDVIIQCEHAKICKYLEQLKEQK